MRRLKRTMNARVLRKARRYVTISLPTIHRGALTDYFGDLVIVA